MELSRIMKHTLLFAGIVFVLLIGVYAFVFYGRGTLANTEYWSHFGSFIGGLTGPLFGFLSVIAVLYATQAQIKASNKAMETQLTVMRSENRIQILLERITNIEDRIHTYLRRELSPRIVLDSSFIKENYLKEGSENQVQIIEKGTYIEVGELLLPARVNALDLLNIFHNLVKLTLRLEEPDETEENIELDTIHNVKEHALKNNSLASLHEVTSISSSLSQMLKLATELSREGYSTELLKFHFSQFLNLSKLLVKYDFLTNEEFICIKFYASYPMQYISPIASDTKLREVIYDKAKMAQLEVEDINAYELAVDASDNHDTVFSLKSNKHIIELKTNDEVIIR